MQRSLSHSTARAEECAASKAIHPTEQYPDTLEAGAGMSKEEQDMIIHQINRRAHDSSSSGSSSYMSPQLERNVSSSSRYSAEQVAAANAVHPAGGAYPESPKAGGGLNKAEQEEQIRSINRRASKDNIPPHSVPSTAASKVSSRHSFGTSSSSSSSSMNLSRPGDVFDASFSRSPESYELDSSLAEQSSSTLAGFTTKEEAEKMGKEYNRRGSVEASIVQSVRRGMTNVEQVASAKFPRPAEPFPDCDM